VPPSFEAEVRADGLGDQDAHGAAALLASLLVRTL
jgi:hypothetical protein